jgi:hypothetical protein
VLAADSDVTYLVIALVAANGEAAGGEHDEAL